ncbi:MAG: NUDIX domain-containing protein [Oscillospiraceae bacterium]|nr:NUDIX domain-containing protein [Oscillospiraceae bacterium]
MKRDRDGSEYALPGGHVRIGETTADGLVRAYKEETGADIRVGNFDPTDKALDDVVAVVVTLHLACRREQFPNRAHSLPDEVATGSETFLLRSASFDDICCGNGHFSRVFSPADSLYASSACGQNRFPRSHGKRFLLSFHDRRLPLEELLVQACIKRLQ